MVIVLSFLFVVSDVIFLSPKYQFYCELYAGIFT